MSSIVVAIGYARLAVAVVLAIIQSIVELIVCPLAVLFQVGMLFYSIGSSIFSWVNINRLLAIALVFALAFFIFVAPFGVTATSEIIETENIVWECAVQPVWEFISRAILRNLVDIYERFGMFFNNALAFFFAQAAPRIVTAVELVQCTLDGGSFSQLFDIPFELWGIVGTLPFAFVGAPRATRIEPVPPGEYGYHFPRVPNILPQDGRFEWNPEYDAQGPAEPATPYFSIRFFIRNLWGQAAYVFDDFGLLVTRIISHLGRPSDRLIPALIVDTNVESSLWREVGDLTCRVSELLALTPVYGYSSTVTPVQTAREDYTGYACQSLRKIACLGAQVSLVLIDLTTRNRPLPTPAGFCSPQAGFNGPPNPSSTEDYFRGFPIVDLFLPNGNPNVNLFRSNINFCEFQVDQGNNNCGGLALGSYSYVGFPVFVECPEWDGQSTPLVNERINYIGRFITCIADLVNVFFELEAVADAPLGNGPVTQVADIITCILNLVIDDLLFVLNSFFGPGCNPIFAISTWVGDRLGFVFIKTLEFAFQDSCAAAIEPVSLEDNIFLCLIALSSRAAPDSFWNGLCDLVNGIPFTGFGLTCDASRKRHTTEQFAARGALPTSLTIGQRLRLGAAYYAYQTRSALDAFDYCLLDPDTSHLVAPRCSSECALGPCIDDALQCVQDKLGANQETIDNYWRGAAAHDSYWASAARGFALAADTFVGCRDGDAARFAETLNATVSVVHDTALRTAFAARNYGTAHEHCLEVARSEEDATSGDTQAYLRCIGLPPEPVHDDNGLERSPLQQYQATLLEHGVARDANKCGELLHRFGVLFDRLELQAANEEHEHYRACSTLLAYGARARSLGNTGEPLAHYLDGWRLPLALTISTEYAPDNELRAAANTTRWQWNAGSPMWSAERADRQWLDSLLAGGNQLLDAQHRFLLTGDPLPQDNTTETGSTRNERHFTRNGRRVNNARRKASFLTAHQVASAAYAYFNYLADVYEKIMIVPSSGEEKDEMAAQLWTRHMVPMSLSIVGDTRAARDARADLSAKLRDASERGASVREVARIFAHSLRWIDRLHVEVDNSAKRGEAMMQGYDVVHASGNGTGIVVEFALSQRPVGGVSMHRPSPALEATLAMRVLRADRHLATSLVLADRQNEPQFAAMRAEVARRNEHMDPFAAVHLSELAGALQAASRSIELRRSPEKRAQVMDALKVITAIDRNLTDAALNGEALAERVGFGSLGALRMVMRVVWNVVNWRLQLDKLPPVQAASAVVDALTTGRHDALRDWLAHRQQYVVGVGYVSNAQYDTYMSIDEWRRGEAKVAELKRSDGKVVADTSRFMLYSSRTAAEQRIRRRIVPELARARLLREAMRNDTFAQNRGNAASGATPLLNGDTVYARWLRTRRQRLLRPRINFRHRARYLVKAGYAHTDVHTAHLAGKTWHAHSVALAAAHPNASMAQRVVVAQMATAEVQSNDFWLGLWDNLFMTLGSSNSEPVSSTTNSLLDDLAVVITDFIDDIADTGSGLIDAFLAQGACDPAEDYELGGTGTYRWGCLPFLPLRLFGWYTPFPAPIGPEFVPPTPLPFGGQLNFFTGPGYLQFPDEMLAPGGDCPNKRDPEQVSPLPLLLDRPISFFATYEQTNACREPGPTPPSRPLCDTINCDYCARTWLNADEFGYTDGVRNIETWSGALRELFRFTLLPEAAPGYLFVLIFYFITQFINFSNLGLLFAFALFCFVFGEIFIVQMPERAFYAYLILETTTLITPFFGTLAAVAYGINLYPMYVLGKPDTLFGQVLFDAISFVLPDNLIEILLRLVVIPIDTFLSAFVDTGITAAVSPLQMRLALSIGGPAPTVAELRYSMYSIYNVFILAVFAGLYIALLALAGYIGFQLLGCLVRIFRNFYTVYIQWRGFLVRRRVANLEDNESATSNTIDDLTEANAALRERVIALSVHDEKFHQETLQKLGDLRRRQTKTEQKLD